MSGILRQESLCANGGDGMKLASDVTVREDDTMTVRRGSMEKKVAENDEYIFNAMLAGITEEKDFVQLARNQEQTDELSANFRMAEFVLEYGNFLSKERTEQDRIIF